MTIDTDISTVPANTVADGRGGWVEGNHGDAVTHAADDRTRAAARGYLDNVRALQANSITADEHRANNRALRTGLTDLEWERAKATAFSALNRSEDR